MCRSGKFRDPNEVRDANNPAPRCGVCLSSQRLSAATTKRRDGAGSDDEHWATRVGLWGEAFTEVLELVGLKINQQMGGLFVDSGMTRWDDLKPGFKWPVAVQQTIAAPAEKVWETIAAPGNLEWCHPFCASNPVHEWPGENARDELHYLNGWVFERRFLRWLEGVGYDLEIGRRGGRTSFVSWRIGALDDASCVLRIVVYSFVLQEMPVILRWAPHLFRLRPQLRSYLSSVTRGFEWYVTRGEPVPRNQFGEHPWFSGR